MHVLHFSWHLEAVVYKPSELVELIAREVAQVEPLDLLQKVHTVPSVRESAKEDVEEAN